MIINHTLEDFILNDVNKHGIQVSIINKNEGMYKTDRKKYYTIDIETINPYSHEKFIYRNEKDRNEDFNYIINLNLVN